MGIPKLIHYCWFGGKELPTRERLCIESWKKHLKDYKFVLWNEDNSNLDSCNYVRQAYNKKQYAFVSDYIRIKVLYEYGGIYLDTDIEVLKNFDSLLKENAFLGFENRTTVGTAVIACEPGADFAKEMVEYYENHDFVDNNGNLNITTNVVLLNGILESKGMKRVNETQYIDGIRILERSVLFPKKKSENEILKTDETITIHHMSASWLTERQKKRGTNKIWLSTVRPILKRILKLLYTILGEKRAKSVEIYIRNLLR